MSLCVQAFPSLQALPSAITTAFVVAAEDVQPRTVTVTLYVPAFAGWALAIDGFCWDDEKPLGPVQL
jgi:hypothetical protein